MEIKKGTVQFIFSDEEVRALMKFLGNSSTKDTLALGLTQEEDNLLYGIYRELDANFPQYVP